MSTVPLKAAHERLLRLKSECEESLAQRTRDGAAVELDQTLQGRLSRMDTMQQQAQAQAAARRAQTRLARIEAALARVSRGSYGFCLACDTPLGEGRLLADPCALWCMECAVEREAGGKHQVRR